MEFVGWIRSNETQEKAWNLANSKYRVFSHDVTAAIFGHRLIN